MKRFRFGFKTVVILIALISLNIVPVSVASPASDGNIYHVWEKVEITLTTRNKYKNPYTEMTVWLDLKGPGFDKRCYGFWDGGNTFRVRITATAPGKWTWKSGSQPSDPGLDGKSGSFTAIPWTETQKAENPSRHGMIQPSANGHAFQYADGTPFFLIGDTWWAAPTYRFPWRDDDTIRPMIPAAGFKEYVAYRKKQEYNCVAILAALPNWNNDDKPARLIAEDGTFIRSGWVQAGTKSAKSMTDEDGNRAFLFPGKVPGYESYFPDVDRINPAYFQSLDRKIDYLNSQGFVPFIEVARRDIGQAWKKYYSWPESYVRYIQYIWIRYQANICLYSPIHFDYDKETIPAEDWNDAANKVIEEYGHPPFGTLAGTNPSGSSLHNWGHTDRARWLTFHQIGNLRTHDSFSLLTEIFRTDPAVPAINGEPYYDGMENAEGGSEEAALWCRSAMYGSVLSGGLGGHIYGAGGWSGGVWSGEVEAASEYPMWKVFQWPSGDQMRHLKTFILSEGQKYQHLVPCKERIQPNQSAGPKVSSGWAYGAATPENDLLLLYFEKECPHTVVTDVKPNAMYYANWFNPVTGRWISIDTPLNADETGRIILPQFPDNTDRSDMDWAIKLTLKSDLSQTPFTDDTSGPVKVSIVTDKNPAAPVLHGIKKLTEVLDAKNIAYEQVVSIDKVKGSNIIVAGLAYGDGLAAQMNKDFQKDIPEVSEALNVWKTNWQKKPVWVITGYDDPGLMYGLLDAAIRTEWGSKSNPFEYIKEIVEKPEIATRAISMYTMNRAYWESRFYDETFWRRYLDMLSKNRFNSLVIIFGYENGGFLAPPYPYFFNVGTYPDIRMVGITIEEQRRNLEALNHLIDLAHDCGIKLSVAIWDHIYRGGVQAGGIAGLEKAPDKPVNGLVWGLNGDNLIPYTKEALARLVQLVPKLDGIEFRMHSESGLKSGEQEAFWADVFHSMKSVAPEMQFVLRAKDMPESVIQSALKEGVNFRIETKYWMEQMGMPFHPTHINKENQNDRRHGYADMLKYPQDYKMYWRLWTGGTTRILLWGSPEYARRFVESTKLYNSETFEVNEPLATKMEAQPHDAKPFDLLRPQYRYYDYEFERYWHFFQVFGRMGYNPETSPELWHKEFEMRFGNKAAPLIETAIHQASWILPRIVASCYPYGCFPTTRGWSEKQRLGDLPQYARAEGSDIQQFASFDEEARILLEGGETAKVRPSMTSRWFEHTSSDINNLIMKAEKAVGNKKNKEFISTITDLKILSDLALYHSRRIPAAVSYRLFELTKDVSALDKAIGYERNAIEAWRQIVIAAGDVYADDLMMGIREAKFEGITHHQSGHWKDELGYMEQGLKTLEQQRKDFIPENIVKGAPQYKVAASEDNDNLFQVSFHPVASAPVDKPLTIKARVSATAGIKWVRLRYRSVNQKEDYKSLEMIPTGEKDSFGTTVPAEQIKTDWDFMYFIEVMDNNGNGKIYPDFNKATPYVIVTLDR